MSSFEWFVAALRGRILREQNDVIAFLREENRVLRAQLRGRLRLSDAERKRLAVLGQKLGRAALAQVATIATADTILRLHRDLTTRRCARVRRQSGRPRVEAPVRSLIRRMATENPTWGYTRIQGAMKNLGHTVGRSTIARILKEQGIPPSGRRPMSWRTFVRAHRPMLLVSDLFTSLEGTLRGLVIHSMALLTDLTTRRMVVHLAIPPGHRLCVSGDAGVHQEVHGVTTMQPESFDVDVRRWGKPAPRTRGSPRGPDPWPHAEQSGRCRAVRGTDGGEEPESHAHHLGASSGRQTRNSRRATSAICSGQNDRVSLHTASASPGIAPLTFEAILSSYDRSAV